MPGPVATISSQCDTLSCRLHVRLARESRLRASLYETSVRQTSEHVLDVAARYGVCLPVFDREAVGLDAPYVDAMSTFARRSALSLPNFVRLFRGETQEDARPNKHLLEITGTWTSTQQADIVRRWNAIVRHGVRPEWSSSRAIRQRDRPPNHRSALANPDAIRRHIKQGVADGRYLIVDKSLLTQWAEIFTSPLGAVEKRSPQGIDIRLINDYSYPPKSSVNDFTLRDNFREISYNPPVDIARRLHFLRTQFPTAVILLMLGDVSSAFRHVPMNAEAVHMFAFIFDDCLIIDLACGFGWCGSPAFYSLAATVINTLYEACMPERANLDPSPFVGNVWCDDHTCVEVDSGSRCHDANIALRYAMLRVLGPAAVNEHKFTDWNTHGKALGLLWDTARGTVSIPPAKLAKALARTNALLTSNAVTKTEVLELLGVLRHVAVCFPSARSFYQRVHDFACSLASGRRRPPSSVVEDLWWFRAILHHPSRFNSIPVEVFAWVARASFNVFMDASDTGLCVLEPIRREYIRQQFTAQQRVLILARDPAWSINVRELQSAVLEATHWGPLWQDDATAGPVVVCLHIDNASAVSWSSKRSSRHPLAQLYTRLLSLAEFQFGIVLAAEHIAGVANTMADAGSRAWDSSHKLWKTWADMSSDWSQVAVQPPYDDLSAVWAGCSVDTPWLSLPAPSTAPTGSSGANSPT